MEERIRDIVIKVASKRVLCKFLIQYLFDGVNIVCQASLSLFTSNECRNSHIVPVFECLHQIDHFQESAAPLRSWMGRIEEKKLARKMLSRLIIYMLFYIVTLTSVISYLQPNASKARPCTFRKPVPPSLSTPSFCPRYTTSH